MALRDAVLDFIRSTGKQRVLISAIQAHVTKSDRSLIGDPEHQQTSWFPPDLAQFSDELLRQRLRVPQETVGLNVLRAHPELIMDLAQT